MTRAIVYKDRVQTQPATVYRLEVTDVPTAWRSQYMVDDILRSSNFDDLDSEVAKVLVEQITNQIGERIIQVIRWEPQLSTREQLYALLQKAKATP